MSLNTITLQGRMTKDPELRYTQSQKPVASFTLAVDRDFVPAGEERGADFIPVVAWQKTAEFVSKNFTKGMMTVVTGRLQNREYTDRNGTKHTISEIVADRVYFGEAKRREHTAVNVSASAFEDLGDVPGDLPF